MTAFLSQETFRDLSWQALERLVARLLYHVGFEGVRIVGQSHDGGADVIASYGGKRWLVQVKRWQTAVGLSTIDETVSALAKYRASVPVVVSPRGFETRAREQQRRLMLSGIPLQLWDRQKLIEMADAAVKETQATGPPTPRPYQEDAISIIVRAFEDSPQRASLIVMATGLGKTFVAADAVRRLAMSRHLRVLVVAHTNELVNQLERAFWPFIGASQQTVIWNSYERPSKEALERAALVFGCLPTVAADVQYLDKPFDMLVIDECHHAGAQTYGRIIDGLQAGGPTGPFLLGLTATPWREDGVDIEEYFGDPAFVIDLVAGMQKGFLSNVDYRIYTDNIDWDGLRNLRGHKLTPKAINRTLFIKQWDEGVILELKSAWSEVERPRAIVFCATIEHAIEVRDHLNAYGFCNAEAIYSGTSDGRRMAPFERNRVLADFQDNLINVVCAVDIFNEGVDVPDVNILVFQRVTHSRRIFIQQLGRGLRISPGKEKVIVLDFVSDIRRFAAGIDLKDKVSPHAAVHVNLPHRVTFRRLGAEDPDTESFLREWLDDVATIEAAGDDAHVLKFPPPLPGGR